MFAWYWPPAAASLATSISVCLYELYATTHGAPSLVKVDLVTPFSLTAFVLGLLLVFRTNSAYDRWWEARKLWGGLGADVLNIARRAVAWAPAGAANRPALVAHTLRWCAAFPLALAATVAAPAADAAIWLAAARPLLAPADAAALEASARPRLPNGAPGEADPAPANMVAVEIGAALAALGMPPMLLATADAGVAALADRVVAAARLRRQPIPVAYTRNTGRFLAIWLLLLPVALYDRFRFSTPAVALLVTFLLVAIDCIAAQLEQPHAVLPLEDLVGAAVRAVTALPEWRAACAGEPAWAGRGGVGGPVVDGSGGGAAADVGGV